MPVTVSDVVAVSNRSHDSLLQRAGNLTLWLGVIGRMTAHAKERISNWLGLRFTENDVHKEPSSAASDKVGRFHSHHANEFGKHHYVPADGTISVVRLLAMLVAVERHGIGFHRACAALRALAERCSGVIFLAPALPPFRPPLRPRETAAGSLPSSGSAS